MNFQVTVLFRGNRISQWSVATKKELNDFIQQIRKSNPEFFSVQGYDVRVMDFKSDKEFEVTGAGKLVEL